MDTLAFASQPQFISTGKIAVLAASVFHFGELTIREVKEYMVTQGIPVRL